MIDLSGVWELSNVDETCSVPVVFPGDIHSALLAADKISDPYFGTNELDVQWVGAHDWVAVRTFDVSDEEAGPVGRSILTIDTFDCVGRIEVNGQFVWSGTNMFVPVRADISGALRSGRNEIRLTFQSAERLAATRAATLPYPVPHTVYPVQSMHRNLVRKVQCHAGWDWGPALMVAGVYGAIRIQRVESCTVTRVSALPHRDADGDWIVPVEVDIECANRDDLDASLLASIRTRILAPDGTLVADTTGAAVADVTSGPAGLVHRLIASLSIHDPLLWWPAGYGEQPLYSIEVTVGDATQRVRTAFRTIELVSEHDTAGRSLFFRVNGRDLWAKGANWIPTDALPSRQTDERYRYLLEAAVGANMNMLRVWGGGQYERATFYELCDELGILLWHDFMFSCSLYPAQEWFAEEVRAEVACQVRRLKHHPSIALWCGNNENVGALGWYPESIENPGRYLIDYDRLNDGVVGRTVRDIDPGRVFWPSSPSAGEGDFSDNWHDDSQGDMHYWSVWHEGKPFSAYRTVTPRFCSEFGFQSFPSHHGVAQFTDTSQFNPTSPDLEHHQRHERGNTVVTETMCRYFRFPFDFENFLYLSQVQQALAIRTAVDFWRSRRPTSMGALYWQLNDLWPVVSWSSIEYDGRLKLLHHEARRFFAPRRLICQVHDEAVEVWIANDTAEANTGAVKVKYLDWTGNTLDEQVIPVTVDADSVAEIARRPLSALPFPPQEAFVVAEWSEAIGPGDVSPPRSDTAVGGGLPVERGWAFLTEPKRCDIEHPRLRIEEIETDGDRTVRVECTEAPAFWVTFQSTDSDVHFGDNGFLMLPGESRDIRTSSPSVCRSVRMWVGSPLEHTTGPGKLNTISARHLRSTY